jgi:Zn-dependent M28 family amino/carboxypeptidase
MQVQTSVANQWLRPAGHSIEELVLDIDKDLKPRSFQVPATLRLDLEVSVRERQREVHNVLAYLPGETDELIVVGAHYDHIGLGYQFSMDSTKRGSVHPGADDNASGTAGVIELARHFARQPKQRRGILFVTFAGEEYGLLGSNYYVNHPPLPLAKTVAMINMDMIGRMRDNKLYVGGMHSGKGFQELVEDLNRAAGFDLADADAGGYGSSDQFSFLPKKIPVLFFFSGLHPDYHTPGDTWDKIDAPDAARLLDLVAGIIERLADAPSRPEFRRR